MESAMSRFTIGREFAAETLINEGIIESDAELTALVINREIEPPILDSAGRERFHVSELSALRERRWKMRAAARKGVKL
jgi:predicted thioredoxin/glutaredoxin